MLWFANSSFLFWKKKTVAERIADIINNLGLNNLNQNQTQKQNQNNSFDLSNILKMQKIISSFNEEDPRKNLLSSIKPFLRKSRQGKIDEYITYLSVITAIGMFNEKKE